MAPNDVPAAMVLLVISLLVVCVAASPGAEGGEREPEREVGWDDLTPEGFEKRRRVWEYDVEMNRKRSNDPKFFIPVNPGQRHWKRMMENQVPGKQAIFADGEFDIKEDDTESHARSTRQPPPKTGDREAQ